MHLTRTLNKRICRVLIGMFLFAQLAVSSYACPMLTQPSSQMVEMGAEPGGAMPAGCDQLDQEAANLCAEHCKFGQQSHDTAPLPVVMAPALNLLYVVVATDAQAIDATRAPQCSGEPLLAASPPPHAILHCVFRI